MVEKWNHCIKECVYFVEKCDFLSFLISVRSEDFEELNLDEDGSIKNEEGTVPTTTTTSVEVVNFPEETNIPATNSCPCECHQDTRNVSYTTKAKHCRKCCIKVRIKRKLFFHQIMTTFEKPLKIVLY